MNTANNLRARKKEKTRRALSRHALRLFADRGFEETTVDEIAAAAGVSRRTFFRYFASKEAVIFADHEAHLGMFRASCAGRRPGESGFDAISRACLDLARVYEKERADLVRHRIIDGVPALLAAEAVLDMKWEAAMAEELCDERADAATQHRSRALAGALMGLVRATLREWRASEGAIDLFVLAEAHLAAVAPAFERTNQPQRRT